jgi:hypothetical protein
MRSVRSLRQRVVDAVAGLDYPAQRWEILASVAAAGADRLTASYLARLPAGTYPDVQAVLAAAFPERNRRLGGVQKVSRSRGSREVDAVHF